MPNEIALQMQDIEVYATIAGDNPTPKTDAMIRAMDSGDLQYLKELLHA